MNNTDTPKTMADLPANCEIQVDTFGDECFINIITLEDGSIFINTHLEQSISGPYFGDVEEAVNKHFTSNTEQGPP
jgi:hypothetical protein